MRASFDKRATQELKATLIVVVQHLLCAQSMRGCQQTEYSLLVLSNPRECVTKSCIPQLGCSSCFIVGPFFLKSRVSHIWVEKRAERYFVTLLREQVVPALN
ncbi:hypothetical protein TNIN_33101 [Trichonephila inaurata madagascariensis]|uniref:Uncharacterized protein n=1 Tax=Trichonephila inaurata madagascariensis TaxID=2747483 RepID=A0A8X6X9E7_9ARAC|nr:hypothetical protein TNIN_33101 [Trichonephila inaurata madagascariensis]